MTEPLCFLPAGDDAILVELADLDTTLTLLDKLIADPPSGIRELVPAARTLLVTFDPILTSKKQLVEQISALDLSVHSARSGNAHEIPVVYDGEDLAEVAQMLGESEEDVVRRHSQATYIVAFTGFAPGFAYMTCDDPNLDLPRRKSPRVRIPAGSVALGGKFSGVYPSSSPGGWQLIGRTPLKMWDTSRNPAALLAPGDKVRFRPISEAPISIEEPPQKTAPMSSIAGAIEVTRSDRPVLFQDFGRSGHASQGVSGSGALDRESLIKANLCVGNARGTPALEVVLGGLSLRVGRAVTVAVAGAPCPLSIRTLSGSTVQAQHGRAIALDAGDEVTLGYPPEGMRSYFAVRGGFHACNVLGSASTDTLARIGPEPVEAGALLALADLPVSAIDPFPIDMGPLPKTGDKVTLDIILGPRTDWFTEYGLSTLTGQEWDVTAESSRVGMRLAGSRPIERKDNGELLSEGTVRGAIQIPHSGQPVIFLSDHPLTGGYPVIGVVARHHLGLAGQIPIGAKVRFNAIADFDPLFRDIN